MKWPNALTRKLPTNLFWLLSSVMLFYDFFRNHGFPTISHDCSQAQVNINVQM